MSDINLSTLLAEARKLDRQKHKDAEVNKLGNLRAGSTGVMSANGDIAGGCHRLGFLRSKGIEIEEISADKHIMFELGFANEDIVYEQLKSVLSEGHSILREEEIPVSWKTTNGTQVSGRPDIVIMDHSEGSPGKPILGLELKSVHSIWTARDVLFGREPKLNNIIQSAHYMWQLNCPFKLMYKSYSQLGQGMVGSGTWMTKQFPEQGQPGSEFVEYNDKGGIKHIKQFEIVYDLRFNSKEVLQYKVEGTEKWISTPFLKQDIARYYEFLSTMESENKIGPIPLTVKPSGEKANYSNCNYCALNNICKSSTTDNLTQWLEKVKAVEITKVQQNNSDK